MQNGEQRRAGVWKQLKGVEIVYWEGNYFSQQFQEFIDAFAKLQKATTSFVRSVCLSVIMEQLGYHCTGF